MNITLTSLKNQTIKELLIHNEFSPKLILILQKEGLNTLNTIKKDETLNLELKEERNDFYLEDLPLNIIYEDEYILIVNKEKNIASIPSIKHYYHNLSNIVMNYYIKKHIESNIHPVTRLDYKTSGLIIFAKHRYIHNLFKNIKIDKLYKAKVKGNFIFDKLYINLPILDTNEMKRIIDKDGKNSISYVEIIENNNDYSILNIKLLTGRTHQIRRHLSYLNYPIIGDNIYSDDNSNLELECYKLEFIHPITNKKLTIKI